jgi:hypothetical protein
MADEGFLANLKQGDIGGLGRNLMEGARDEWLGIDDFSRFGRYLGQGDFLKALKSLGAGTLELGGSALMLVPGGQAAALAAKGGKAGKALNVLRPLSLQERGAAKLASKGGAARSLKGMPKVSDVAELIGKEITISPQQTPSALRRIIGGMTDEFGYSRGGVLGSLARGAGQLTGQFPTAQGPLARGILGGRIRAPYLSGKLGPLAMRTGIDTQLMSPFMTDVEQVDPYQQALAQILLGGYGSPGAAY